LLLVPQVRVEDLFVRPDPNTGKISVQVNVRNAAKDPQQGHLQFSVAPGASGETLGTVRIERTLPPGNTRIDTELQIDNPHRWDLGDPYLYRVTARVQAEQSTFFDERCTRCGFRDFRFADGYFRLNGRRIYLRGSHTCNHYPIGLQFPHDPDLLRRDLLNMKAMGFNVFLGPTLNGAPSMSGAPGSVLVSGHDAAATSRRGEVVVAALLNEKILPMPMGFPGGGANRLGNDPAVLVSPREYALNHELLPYRRAIEAGVPGMLRRIAGMPPARIAPQ